MESNVFAIFVGVFSAALENLDMKCFFASFKDKLLICYCNLRFLVWEEMRNYIRLLLKK